MTEIEFFWAWIHYCWNGGHADEMDWDLHWKKYQADPSEYDFVEKFRYTSSS